MRLARRVNLGGFQSMEFASNERTAISEAAQDLVDQMVPLVQAYPILKQVIAEIRTAYRLP